VRNQQEEALTMRDEPAEERFTEASSMGLRVVSPETRLRPIRVILPAAKDNRASNLRNHPLGRADACLLVH
jgi:hypothetical protein